MEFSIVQLHTRKILNDNAIELQNYILNYT